jgi:geranylgeranyl reductase family protein
MMTHAPARERTEATYFTVTIGGACTNLSAAVRHNPANCASPPVGLYRHVVIYDAIIVGAGPAGSAAALVAHQRGLDVAVIDKATFPRDKTCGDGLTAQALRLLRELGCDVTVLPSAQPIAHTVMTRPDGSAIALPLPNATDYSVVVPRRDLDAMLVDRVGSTGAPMFFGEGVARLDVDQHISVTTDVGRTLQARYVIAADGHYSRVRRLQQQDATRDVGEWHAVRQYFDNVHTPDLVIDFAPDLLPGYAWVFPLPNGRANVGMCVLRSDSRNGRALRDLWQTTLTREPMRAAIGAGTPAESVHAWPIPSGYQRNKLTDHRVLYVGDAAAVVDPLTGEGIAQALETGMLAAHAIADGGPNVAARYRAAVEQHIGRDHRFARALRRILGTRVGATVAFTAIDANAWTRRNFARWMFEDYPRATILTPERWSALRRRSSH